MKHISYITKKPEKSGVNSTPDGAYTGNGDLGIVLGNCENGMRIYLCKIDLWQGIEIYIDGGLRPLGYIDIPIDEKLYNNYHVEQDMDVAEIRCNFKNGNEDCSLKIFVCKEENSIIIENTGNVDINPVLKVFEGKTAGKKGEYDKDGTRTIFRSFEGEKYLFETHCFASFGKADDNRWYLFTATNHDLNSNSPEEIEKHVTEMVKNTGKERLDILTKIHHSLWEEFWGKSSFTMSDEEFENQWYASQYILACSSGNKHFPPGLFGNYVAVETPPWHSDYHLNYNYQAPYYGACSSNHIELTDNYHVPLEEMVERGKGFAEKFGCKGILFPVGMGPKGILTEYNPDLPHWFIRLFLGQKNNQIHPADIMVFRWKATRDKEYAKEHAFPYLKECLQFFEDYAVFENGRYSICKDAAHEVPMYRPEFDETKFKYRYVNDKNNVLTLGLLRLCLEAAIDMAKELQTEEEKQKKWQNILEKLSPFPTTIRHFRRVYRYTEKGQRWNDSNDVGLHHIYPSGCIGLSSDEKDLKIARESFRQRNCWFDDNAMCSYFPMAARLGIEPSTITDNFRKLIKNIQSPNMLFSQAGGCLEDCSIAACTFNEMALQSHQGLIRLFPCWDKKINAEFKSLRADGAFLVSSSIKSGNIGKTEIISEVGYPLKLLNPFGKCKITINGKEKITEEEIISLSTSPNDIITVEKA